MTWSTLAAVRLCTRLEFVPRLARRHHFVRLPSGRWTRTLGPPDGCRAIGNRRWEVVT